MGMAKLNIFVSRIDDPCKISRRTWYVTIYNCDGSVLSHCGRRYVVLPARCGHLEVDVPPGCYYIKAVWGYRQVGPGVYRANHFTDAAIIQACCEQTTCVKLFNPSIHRCGFIYALALRDLAAQKLIDPALAERAERLAKQVRGQDARNAKERAVERAPNVRTFENDPDLAAEMERLIAEQEKERG